MSQDNVLNMGSDFLFSTIEDVKNHILYRKYATHDEIDTLILSNTLIEHMDLSQLPTNIKNVTSTDGSLMQLSWTNLRPYGILTFVKNEFSDLNVSGSLVCDALILDNNKIKTPRFENFKCNKLSLKHNFITVPIFFNTHIENLDLSHNMIGDIVNLPNAMVTLDLSHNNLKKITQIFPETLTHLNLSHNKLSSVVHLPSSLLYLDISYNNFTNVSDIFNVLPKMLKKLDVSNNCIKEPENMFISFEGEIDYSNMRTQGDIYKSVIISSNSDDEYEDFDNITCDHITTNDDPDDNPFINQNFSFFGRDKEYRKMYSYGLNKRKNAYLTAETFPHVNVPVHVEVKRYSNKTLIIPRWEIQL